MLTKKEFRSIISEKTGFTSTDVSKVLDTTIEVVKDELIKGEKVSFHGLCTFNPVKTEAKEKTFRNPRTGETVTKFCESTVLVKVKPEKSLVRAINGK